MASIIADGFSEGWQTDPFQDIDCQTARALLEAQLTKRLGKVAQQECAGLSGACRVQLQRLLPGFFGAEITPARIHHLYQVIELTSEMSPGKENAYDRERSVYQGIQSTIQWPERELRGYLSQVDENVRQRGSIAFVLGDLMHEMRTVMESMQAQADSSMLLSGDEDEEVA